MYAFLSFIDTDKSYNGKFYLAIVYIQKIFYEQNDYLCSFAKIHTICFCSYSGNFNKFTSRFNCLDVAADKSSTKCINENSFNDFYIIK